MKFKITLQNGDKVEVSTPDFESASEFADLVGRLESGKFVIIGKNAISKDHVVMIQEID
ncbi:MULTISPECIES: hypothetical protein [unclassified Lysinibacillus]|uniref:hypothetical protein n=1 Tax=unclassified Lysinibacillus TaxID=2636778 RepID=UPI00232F4E17|nr:hypothetical protein [Lysinibacillus sp. OF-1]WCH45814.1 hypothetical protein NV349_11915 [Lysinibacillus sp. OF-1]